MPKAVTHCQYRECRKSLKGQEKRRYVTIPWGEGERKIEVCTACFTRQYRRGTLKRGQGDHSKVAPKIIALYKQGIGPAELGRRFPDVPRRSLYQILQSSGAIRARQRAG